LAHRQAGGRDDRPVTVREPPAECAVVVEFEPAVNRVDVIAFSVRSAAEKFIADLAARTLACACVELEVTTANGEVLVRRWRQTGVLTAADVIDRVRWQIEGWLHQQDVPSPSAGIVRLRIVPVEVVPTGTHQQALWGGAGESDVRAQRALARVQTLLGLAGVVAPTLAGGRSPAQRTEYVAWGEERTMSRSPEQPWPGRLPSPAPSVVLDPPSPVRLLDAVGRSVVVSERGALARPPSQLGIGDDAPVQVSSWAGPWPADERWWDPASAARVARIQLVDVRGRAYLLAGEMAPDHEPSWVLEGIYD
jgi:protein ImuB